MKNKVYIAWDVGVNDYTSIVYYKIENGVIKIIKVKNGKNKIRRKEDRKKQRQVCQVSD